MSIIFTSIILDVRPMLSSVVQGCLRPSLGDPAWDLFLMVHFSLPARTTSLLCVSPDMGVALAPSSSLQSCSPPSFSGASPGSSEHLAWYVSKVLFCSCERDLPMFASLLPSRLTCCFLVLWNHVVLFYLQSPNEGVCTTISLEHRLSALLTMKRYVCIPPDFTSATYVSLSSPLLVHTPRTPTTSPFAPFPVTHTTACLSCNLAA